MDSFSIRHTARSYPRLPYERIKNDILGPRYELSLVFVGTTRAQKLNQTYRHKSYVPNVLSFPLSKTAGEVFIAPQQAKKEAHKHHMTPKGYIGFLFIHALLHLKGHTHGDTMSNAERAYCRKYSLR